MKIIISILALCISGCAYEPWEKEAYHCDDSHWIAPHTYKTALINRKKHENILIGDFVIKPFLAPSGGLYDGHSPYRMWFQIFAGSGSEAKFQINKLTCKRSDSETLVLSTEPVSFDLSNGYAAYTFQTPIPLDFKNKETATLAFEFTVADGTTTTNFQRNFEFKPVLLKGSFKSLY